ncbi:MAG: NisI/SpaI family lantibiotic immunity lipoprotein [Streptococcus sp.]|jgi:nisin immunity protein|uniref:NisI/SpaI family lantibiotic immunity lipoprotein n=1 Tax=Streptococcus sp. TaxID=1306 RepID=UPI0039962B74
MGRRASIIVSILLVLLTGCGLNNTEKIEFSKTDFRHITFNHKDYSITDNEISKDNIRNVLVKDYKVIWINSHTGKILSKVSNNSCTLAIMNIFQTSDKLLCIGIDDKYFQIAPKDQTSNLLNISRFSSKNTNVELDSGDDILIDDNNCRRIFYRGEAYYITSEEVSSDKVGVYIDNLAEVRLFDAETGKKISNEERYAIYNKGEAKDRVNWFYGEVYSIKNSKDDEESLVVKINNVYRRAMKEE